MVSLPGQALATQTLSFKGWEERVEGDGSDVIICVFTRDHGEESLPLPPGTSVELHLKILYITSDRLRIILLLSLDRVCQLCR